MDSRIRRVLDYLDAHWAEDLSLKDLARVGCLSEYHFSRVFTLHVGRSPFAYLRDRRIREAQALLASSDAPVTEVALRTGFPSLSHFNETFKAASGLTPTAYRRGHLGKKPGEPGNRPGAPEAVGGHTPPTPFFRRIMEMNLTPVELDPIEAAYLTQKGSYLETGALWARLTAWAFARGLFPPQARYFGISYDEPGADDGQKTTDVCVALPPGFGRGDPEVLCKTVPGGTFLRYEFYDRVDRLALVYRQAVTEYLPASPWDLDDRDFLEFVGNDPASDPEGKIRIDLCIPVRPR